MPAATRATGRPMPKTTVPMPSGVPAGLRPVPPTAPMPAAAVPVTDAVIPWTAPAAAPEAAPEAAEADGDAGRVSIPIAVCGVGGAVGAIVPRAASETSHPNQEKRKPRASQVLKRHSRSPILPAGKSAKRLKGNSVVDAAAFASHGPGPRGNCRVASRNSATVASPRMLPAVKRERSEATYGAKPLSAGDQQRTGEAARPPSPPASAFLHDMHENPRILTVTIGQLVEAIVNSANMQNCEGVPRLLRSLRRLFPCVNRTSSWRRTGRISWSRMAARAPALHGNSTSAKRRSMTPAGGNGRMLSSCGPSPCASRRATALPYRLTSEARGAAAGWKKGRRSPTMRAHPRPNAMTAVTKKSASTRSRNPRCDRMGPRLQIAEKRYFRG
jgi:hypothetical protein